MDGGVPRNLIAKFYRAADGTQPVDDYISQLQPAVRVALDRQIERINLLDEFNPHLAFPHSSQIEGELRELRCHYGKTLYRILYRRSGQFIVLLHAFNKRSRLVPEEDKRIAQERWHDFKTRLEAHARKVPGPIGKKAPSRRRP